MMVKASASSAARSVRHLEEVLFVVKSALTWRMNHVIARSAFSQLSLTALCRVRVGCMTLVSAGLAAIPEMRLA